MLSSDQKRALAARREELKREREEFFSAQAAAIEAEKARKEIYRQTERCYREYTPLQNVGTVLNES